MISIIMNTYKEEVQLIEQSIESILNQTYNGFEFIIVLDNEKNVSHVQTIKRYCEQDKRIHFYVNPNPGRVNALNYAISKCNCDYIAIIDADDVPLKID